MRAVCCARDAQSVDATACVALQYDFSLATRDGAVRGSSLIAWCVMVASSLPKSKRLAMRRENSPNEHRMSSTFAVALVTPLQHRRRRRHHHPGPPVPGLPDGIHRPKAWTR